MRRSSALSNLSKQRQWFILGILIVLVACVIFVNVFLLSQQSNNGATMPTQMAMLPSQSVTPSAQTQTTLATQPLDSPTSPAEPTGVDSATVPATTNALPIATAISTSQVPSASTTTPLLTSTTQAEAMQPVATSMPRIEVQPSSEANLTSTTVLASPTPSLEQLPSEIPLTSLPSPTRINAVPTATLSSFVPENAVPRTTVLDVGLGEMRIIDAMRPAEQRIRDLGGSIPAAPANQSWVLVESLLVCREKNACTIDLSSFEIVGSSGAHYKASTQLNMTPILGSVVSNGQAWGYLGFIVPSSENCLYFVMSHLGQSYVFILE